MKGINAVAVQTKETVKGKLNAPFRIVHQGVPYADGAVIEVPKDDTTDLAKNEMGCAGACFTERQKLMPFRACRMIDNHADMENGRR
jgi:hypothetical protein